MCNKGIDMSKPIILTERDKMSKSKFSECMSEKYRVDELLIYARMDDLKVLGCIK